MPETGRTPIPSNPVARTIAQIRELAPTAGRVRAHRSPSGAYCVTVLDAHGSPVELSAAASWAIGSWIAHTLPTARRNSPHALNLETCRFTCAVTGEEVPASALAAAARR